MRKPRHGASPLFVQTLNHLHLPKNNPTESEEANGPACGSLLCLFCESQGLEVTIYSGNERAV